MAPSQQIIKIPMKIDRIARTMSWMKKLKSTKIIAAKNADSFVSNQTELSWTGPSWTVRERGA